ncbi:hypothetical protein BGZ61DRAFT_364143 [Ilyonectria robusta]|uniref:uncharacterized protein n=1 Tax=Ilyonectria robusta TaxID=1079257 RepID=UPI001E8DB318|nr:uncharacterized protein BGZ61DRAFT_364143 [Ilyonectria robusta]KAH8669413.1 hypothetical protein BGZ61DRAFT_364143 [Ilyonectria robusta]
MADAYPHLTWSQVAPGVWQRGIDEIEQFYSSMVVLYEASGRMFFGITGFLSLSVEVPKNMDADAVGQEVDKALEKAWLSLRYDHPTLASQITQNIEKNEWTKSYTQFKDENDRIAWLQNTFVPVSTGQTGLEWANSDPPAPRLPTLFVVKPTTVSTHPAVIRRDLVFRSPHDIIDGIGTLIMLNNLIGHASRAFRQGATFKLPIFDGSEVVNLSPSYRIAANVPVDLSPEQKTRLEGVIAQKAGVRAATDIEILALPYRKGALVPGKHQRVALTLSAEQTTHLLAVCKAAEVTLTHLFHAAAAMVDRDIQPPSAESKRVRYINYILRNERSSCVEPYNTTKHPAALYHSVSGPSLVVDMDLLEGGKMADPELRKEEFHSIVRQMKDFYHEVRHDTEHSVLAPDLWAIGNPTVPPSPRPLPVPPPNPHPSVSISSMGRVDIIVAPKTGDFRVHDAWVTGEELGNGLGLFLGTFDGKLCLSAAYNDAWHTEEDVSGFLRRCREIVFDGMGIPAA